MIGDICDLRDDGVFRMSYYAMSSRSWEITFTSFTLVDSDFLFVSSFECNYWYRNSLSCLTSWFPTLRLCVWITVVGLMTYFTRPLKLTSPTDFRGESAGVLSVFWSFILGVPILLGVLLSLSRLFSSSGTDPRIWKNVDGYSRLPCGDFFKLDDSPDEFFSWIFWFADLWTISYVISVLGLWLFGIWVGE